MTTDVILEELSDETEVYVARLRLQTTEPQNAIPDVVIWMISGNKRIASCRVPASSLMFSETSRCRGKMCGKFQTIFLTPLGVEKLEDLEDRLKYVSCCGWAWSSSNPNAKGKVKQPKEAFVVPDGWKWDGDWFINPELSIAFEADEGLNEWQEDIYENQIRAPFSSWPNDPTKSYWSDVRGDKLIAQENEKEAKELTRDDIQPPEGWRWAGDWQVDKNRACEREGFGEEDGEWFYLMPIMQWCQQDVPTLQEKRMKAIEEGWEYARLANLPYHLTEHSLDLARCRRWHRKMVALNARKPAVFYFEGEKKASTCEMCCI
ncbi:hypothetical protein EMCRGX_G029676 [Ephydatia muelleri]